MLLYFIQIKEIALLLKTLTLLFFCSTLGSTLLALHYQSEVVQLQQKRQKSITLAKQISSFSTELRIATYPTACDEQSQAILGEACDLGNYMEWAGPHLEAESDRLVEMLTNNNTL